MSTSNLSHAALLAVGVAASLSATACSSAVADSEQTAVVAQADQHSVLGGFLAYPASTSSMGTSLCLGAANSKVQAGILLDIENCNDNRWANLFVLHADQSIRAAGNENLCLEPVNGTLAVGSLVELATCNGSTPQKWTAVGGTIGTVGRSSNGIPLCIDLWQQSGVDHNLVDLNDCNAIPSEEWWPFGFSVQFMSDPDPVSLPPSGCMAVGSGGFVAGAGLTLRSCDANDDTQVFTLTEGKQITNHGLYVNRVPGGPNTGPTGGLLELQAQPGAAWSIASYGSPLTLIDQPAAGSRQASCIEALGYNVGSAVGADTCQSEFWVMSVLFPTH